MARAAEARAVERVATRAAATEAEVTVGVREVKMEMKAAREVEATAGATAERWGAHQDQ